MRYRHCAILRKLVDMVYRDSHGRTLDNYPRPSVAVDTAVLTVPPGGELRVVVITSRQSANDDAESALDRLPGTFLHSGETLTEAVRRSLRAKAGINGLRPRQLHVFDEPERDPRGWVISVAHADTVPAEQLDTLLPAARLEPVAELPSLAYGHSQIVALAVEQLREQYRATPDPAGLLGSSFTLRELHTLHEIIAGTALQRDTFRRAMVPHLTATGERSSGGMGKPAELFHISYRTTEALCAETTGRS
jgi:8-oxo-dGTP diphosphatase